MIINVELEKAIMEKLARMAEHEKRSKRQMAQIIIEEALKKW